MKLSLIVFYLTLILIYGSFSLTLDEIQAGNSVDALIAIDAVLILVSFLCWKSYSAKRTRYIAFVGSKEAWEIAKFEMRYAKMKWVRSSRDINGDQFTEVYCTEQHIRRYEVLYKACVSYVEHLKRR